MANSPVRLEDAQALDRSDTLRGFRDQFLFPAAPDGTPWLYLCGNSLGLQPTTTRETIASELDAWAQLGVKGHFHADKPWYSYHEPLIEPMARVVGAQPNEVALMNGLTTNLHLLMVSFYRPTSERYKIVIERGAFPSDRYAVASQARFHGYDPNDAIIELGPREGEDLIRIEDIEACLRDQADTVALIMLGGVNYLTGQAFDMARITRAAHAIGAMAGFDLAHAAGNLHLQLHDWDVDFAAWCTYKYLNAGPGGVGGIFVHDRHCHDPAIPRFEGWWGTDPETRFEMRHDFEPQPGAGAWMHSNVPVLTLAALQASLEIFQQATIAALREKSVALTRFAQTCVEQIDGVAVITPSEVEQRGAQLSLRTATDARALHQALFERHVVCDFRVPDVIRIAPAPLYNTFEDVWRFADIMRTLITRG